MNPTNQIKVVHVTTVDISLSHLLLNQLRYLARAGYAVESISAPGPFAERVVQAGIPHHAVPMTRQLVTPLQDLVALVSLVRALKRGEYDIVHVHTPKASFLGQIAARLAGTPIVIRTLHGFYFHDGTSPALRRILIWLERFAARFGDAILSQNSEDIQTAVAERICPPEKISLLGNGIDLGLFHPGNIQTETLEAIRAEFSLDPRKKVIGFVGRLVTEKGLPELLEAARILQARRDDFQLLLVGPMDHARSGAVSPDQVEEWGQGSTCQYVGFQDDMPQMYSLMDLFVLPSHREGFPRSLMEASAMGIPAIATDIRGCREVISPGENGLLVPVQDPSKLAEAIERLLDDPVLQRNLKEGALRVAREKFDEVQVFRKVQGAYEVQLARKFPS